MNDMKLDVQDWLPHTPPMLMLSEVLAYTDESIDGISRIRADNPLLEGKQFPCLGGVELLAELAGVLFGIRNTPHKLTSCSNIAVSNEPPRGAVVQLKSFELGDIYVPVGADLNVHADFIGGSQQAAKMSGTVYFGENRVFEGTLMIALFEGQVT